MSTSNSPVRAQWRCVAFMWSSAAFLIPGPAFTQPRSDPEVSREAVLPVTEPAAIAEWLARLVGKYEYEGMVTAGECTRPSPADGTPVPSDLCQKIEGNSDCVGIGTGPGVHCILNVTWLDIWNINYEGGSIGPLPGGEAFLSPAMVLFGIDPGAAKVNYLLVDHKGLPEGGLGSIKGARATFRTPCVNGPALLLQMNTSGTCKRTIRIDAKPEGSLVHLSMDIEIEGIDGVKAISTRYEMSLRRL
jgi:hypothetical protein